MDVLVTLTTTISYIYSVAVILVAIAFHFPYSPMTFFDTPPMLFLSVSLGRWIEYCAKSKTSDALTKLMRLQPAEARLCQLDPATQLVVTERMIDSELVKKGDIIKVLPGIFYIL